MFSCPLLIAIKQDTDFISFFFIFILQPVVANTERFLMNLLALSWPLVGPKVSHDPLIQTVETSHQKVHCKTLHSLIKMAAATCYLTVKWLVPDVGVSAVRWDKDLFQNRTKCTLHSCHSPLSDLLNITSSQLLSVYKNNVWWSCQYCCTKLDVVFFGSKSVTVWQIYNLTFIWILKSLLKLPEPR